MALSIRNPRAEQLAREVAAEAGEIMMQAIIHSLEDRLQRLRGRRAAPSTVADILAVSRRCSTLPDQDPRSPEEILGYGEDGDLWGGEILHVQGDEYSRIGHLERFPLLGGEMAVKEPKRLVLGMISSAGGDIDMVDIDGRETLLKLADTSLYSTSYGRTLDALSSLGGICDRRTYRGEPAMLLERYLCLDKDSRPWDIEVNGKAVDANPAIADALEMMQNGGDFIEISSGMVKGMLDAMVELALTTSNKVGITGGVAYNEPIVRWFKHSVTRKGGIPFTHERVPPGDGGVSVGQAVLSQSITE